MKETVFIVCLFFILVIKTQAQYTHEITLFMDSPDCVASVSNDNLSDKITLYPNPSSSPKVHIGSEVYSSLEVKVMDMLGNLVKEEEVGSGVSTIDLTGLPRSTYLIHIKGKDFSAVKRWVYK